jgi:PPOX class probable F420-dependent enzyme
MENMTPDECRHFLSEGRRTGKVATVRRDGRPHVVPVWFILDGDDVVFTAYSLTAKFSNMQHDPRIAICVDEEAPPFSYVMVEGTVVISTPPAEEKLMWATRIARRYMGDELAEVYGKRHADTPEELLVRVTPTKIIGLKNIVE